MKRKKIYLLLVCVCFFIFFSFSCKKEREQISRPEASESSKILHQVAEDYSRHLLEESLYLRLKQGLSIEKLPDLSFSYARSEADYASSVLEKLARILPEELSHEEYLTLEILRWEAKNTVEGLRFFWLSFPITPYSSLLPYVHRAFMIHEFRNVEDLKHYLFLLEKYRDYGEEIKTRLEEQQKRGIVIPKDELEIVIPFLSSFIEKSTKSIFFVREERLKAIEEEERREFQKKVASLIETEINPVLENLLLYVKGDYAAKAPDSVGLWQYPQGKDYYLYLIRVQTTLELSPEEIHHIGLEEVEKDIEKIDEIRQAVGFDGSREYFRQFLKKDPRFFPSSPQEIETRLNSYLSEINARLSLIFMRKPKAPYGVERLAPELEEAMTFGFYDPPTKKRPKGIYYYNGSKLSERSLLMAEGLIYHELVPGHHFHIATQFENEQLPLFRRETIHNAFTEGWAEYASWLALECGLFNDPYSLCGKYLMDLFLSTRLVVDTGMNFFEWPRSQAIKFMKENLIESETQIKTETLRYSADIPAQALGYKLGSMKMFELRKKAEKKLGDRFDLRKFHDALLESGSLPFPLLEKHIDWFIEQELSRPET